MLYVDADYQRTVIGRSKRDYVWIMARDPQIPESHYRELAAIVEQAGYDPGKLQQVRQRWPGKNLGVGNPAPRDGRPQMPMLRSPVGSSPTLPSLRHPPMARDVARPKAV